MVITDKVLEVRQASLHDKTKIFNLYSKVSETEGGIARNQAEITEDWVLNCLLKSLANGVMLVVQHPEKDELIAEIHTYPNGLQIFNHVFGDLTVGVHPDFQGSGIGRLIFEHLLEEVKTKYPEILRVELIVRESNIRAINFYEKIGFVKEGRMEKRIYGIGGDLEADIPMAWFNPNYKK
ncbi:MAG: GNAT family N-acetyltransferase [Verrucomicrobia bacterium]|nr:GNAT family N-acetyltransferase [Cytophagales bacterium]